MEGDVIIIDDVITEDADSTSLLSRHSCSIADSDDSCLNSNQMTTEINENGKV